VPPPNSAPPLMGLRIQTDPDMPGWVNVEVRPASTPVRVGGGT
jgi:hypothetical protein